MASRQNAHISSAVGAVTPEWLTGATASPTCRVDFADSRATSSATESSPSSAPSATRARGQVTESMPPIVAAGQYGRIAPDGGPAIPRARDAAGSGVPPGSDREDGSVAGRPPGTAFPSLLHMEATIEVAGLRKRFGPALALDGMTFTVSPGQVTGFVGPNGAGKSTTMRVILGLDAADAGTATVGGRPYASLRHPLSQVGSLLDAAALQPSRSARNHLLWLAHSQGLGARRANEVIEQAGLGPAARRKAGGYSLGMRQRLGIAAALLGDPPVLMFDEPFNGMDPEGIVWMRGFLRSLAAQGRAVLVSSHLMGELQDTADHLVVAGRGRVVADASVADADRRRVRRPGDGAYPGARRGDDRAGPGRGRGRRYGSRRHHCLRPDVRTGGEPAVPELGAVR